MSGSLGGGGGLTHTVYSDLVGSDTHTARMTYTTIYSVINKSEITANTATDEPAQGRNTSLYQDSDTLTHTSQLQLLRLCTLRYDKLHRPAKRRAGWPVKSV